MGANVELGMGVEIHSLNILHRSGGRGPLSEKVCAMIRGQEWCSREDAPAPRGKEKCCRGTRAATTSPSVKNNELQGGKDVGGPVVVLETKNRWSSSYSGRTIGRKVEDGKINVLFTEVNTGRERGG